MEISAQQARIAYLDAVNATPDTWIPDRRHAAGIQAVAALAWSEGYEAAVRDYRRREDASFYTSYDKSAKRTP